MGLEGPAMMVSWCYGCRLGVMKEEGGKEGKVMSLDLEDLRAR